MKIEKKHIVILCIILFAILAIGAVIITAVLSKQEVNLSIQKPKETEEVIIVSEGFEEGEDKTEITDLFTENFDDEVLNMLSVGDFEGLLAKLTEFNNTLTQDEENEGINLNYSALINQYMNDIGVITNYTYSNIDSYQTSDCAAAAWIYLPVSVKVDIVSNKDSIIFPALNQGQSLVKLTKRDASYDDLTALASNINAQRSSENQIRDVAVYDCTLYSTQCEIIVVLGQDFAWHIYKMNAVSEECSAPTVSTLLQQREMKEKQGQTLDLDTFYFIPE